MPDRLYPRTTLALLTALNFLNYIDRSVLFAVQPLVQKEFPRSDAEFGFLTTAFFFCYMLSAPLIGPLADRVRRRPLIVVGALVWSAATLLTAFTYDFRTLLIRHTIVGIGEATFVTIAPSYIADLFAESRRGRMLSIFYIAIAAGTAVGYIVGGQLGPRFGWRVPFYVAALPGFVAALGMMALPEPRRGAHDTLTATAERATLRGLTRNGAFWTATLGMAMVTFALGGLQVWMPTFLSRVHHIPLDAANFRFGLITLFNGIVATLLGGWIGDRLLRRTHTSYYLVSAVAGIVSVPFMFLAINTSGMLMYPAIFAAEFLLLLNTGPLNAALVDSVGASIRASAIAVNLFTIHLLGDAFSPTLIGYISDRSSLQHGFLAALVAMAISAAVLFYGMRFAPRIRTSDEESAGVPA